MSMLTSPTSRFRATFPDVAKPVIAMAHLPPLPGTPLYDAVSGVQGLVDFVKREVEVLLEGGVDAIMFCNEGDRPYQLRAGLEGAAVLSRVVTECAPSDIPYGVDFLWDPSCALAVAAATSASFMREVVTGFYESDMGPWSTDAGALLRERRRLGADNVAVFMNVTPEFASPIGGRGAAEVARSVSVSSLPDAILVSGPMAGAEPAVEAVARVRDTVPADIPVLLNTGAKSTQIDQYWGIVDGCIVGSDLKVGGHTWNPVDPQRVADFIAAVRSCS
jgi:membrane complex biogenesis BtpA family protein